MLPRCAGQHVERIGRDPHGFDLAGEHALHTYRAADQVGPVLGGEQHAAGDLSDLVPGPPDALQSAGHRRRSFHLDHQSTAPMSIPSSRLDVATTDLSRPLLRSSSTAARCSLDTEP